MLPQYSHRVVSEGTQREDAATAILGLASWESQDQGLVNRQIAAGATNQFVHGIRVYKLETVAKRTLFNSTFSPKGVSIGSMAAIPVSLMSTICPFSKPRVRELIVISTLILNRG